MRLDGQEDVKVSGRTSTQPCLALACKPDARTVLDAGRNVDRKRTLFDRTALPRALAAGVFDDLATALTLRTGALDREEALGCADPADAVTHLALYG